MPKNEAVIPTPTTTNITPTNNTTTKGNNDVAISPALPARWGYLPMDTDCDQQARSRDREARKRRDQQLHKQLVACLVALPVATLALVAVCVAVVMSAASTDDYYGPSERMYWERSR